MEIEKVNEGKMFIFTAPSGAGKTTIVRHLLGKYPYLGFSISATTRSKRDHEVEGKDYYFMTIDQFKQKVDQGAFIEWEEVYEGQFYGTLSSEVHRIWDSGKHLVFDIDVRGAINIKKYYTDKCMSIFVKPPSFDILKQRLIDRNTESEESLLRRISKVQRELTYENSFDLVLVNNKLDLALVEAEHIVHTFIFGLSDN